MVQLNVYKNNDSTSEQYGKAYVRVDYKEMYDIDKLAEHMAVHNTPFTKGTIKGILTDMVGCIRHLTLDGNTAGGVGGAVYLGTVRQGLRTRRLQGDAGHTAAGKADGRAQHRLLAR